MIGPWGSPPAEPTREPPVPAEMARALLLNLRAGLRVAAALRATRHRFIVTGRQAVAITMVAALLALTYTTVKWRGIALEYVLDSGWFSMLAASCVLLLVAAYALSIVKRDPQGISGFSVIVISSMLLPIAAFLAATVVMPVLMQYAYAPGGRTWLFGAYYSVFVALFVWCTTTLTRSLRITYRLRGAQSGLLALLLIAVFVGPTLFDWSAADSESAAEAEEESSVPYDLDVEETFYAQPVRVDRAVALMGKGRPGVTDLYFVGFGSYAPQNVFRSEVEKISALFADRFDTAGRSVELINHADTVASLPIASVSNLKRLLPQLASRMDRNEDVLFLFLTSHGSPGVVSVDFYPLELNSLRADELDRMLEASGIKWRVIVISACYSGSFIEPLKDENSLIITASRGDRTSFGCSNENEFTYFGDAYFNQALRQERDFIAAFEQARKTVAARETAENLTPSEPQIHVGAAIRERLKEVENRLNAMSAAASGAGGRASTDLGNATR